MAQNNHEPPAGKDVMSWTVLPARRHFKRTLGAVLLILTIGIGVGISFSPPWGIFSVLILFISLARFFLPTTYRLTSSNVEILLVGFNQKRSWSDIRRVEKSKGGVFLSPFAKQNRLEHYRGLFLICPDNREDVYEFAKRHSHHDEDKD